MQIIVTCRTSDNNPKFRPEVNNSHALWFGVPNQSLSDLPDLSSLSRPLLENSF